jgi:hypothetical protein
LRYRFVVVIVNLGALKSAILNHHFYGVDLPLVAMVNVVSWSLNGEGDFQNQSAEIYLPDGQSRSEKALEFSWWLEKAASRRAHWVFLLALCEYQN